MQDAEQGGRLKTREDFAVTGAAGGTHAAKRYVVLFVCLGNACRSPMAEAIARSDTWDVIEPMSAGIMPLGFVVEETIETLLENGHLTDGLKSKWLNKVMWDSADMVINMTGRPTELAFRGFSDLTKVEEWRVSDPYGEDHAVYQRIYGEIQERVAQLAERLRGRRAPGS